MKNWVYLYSQSIPANLASYLGDRPDRLAGSEIPLAPSARNHFDVRVPDLIVALDCDVERFIAERGYSLESQGKPPDFILDIAPGFAFRSDYAAPGAWTSPATASASTGALTAATTAAPPRLKASAL